MDSHWDWLLADPRAPQGRLIAYRLPLPSAAFDAAGAWPARPLPPHRRLYLAYQGPVAPSPDRPNLPRGRVLRIDEGTFHPKLWTEARQIIDVSLRHFRGVIEMRRLGEQSIRCACLRGGGALS